MEVSTPGRICLFGEHQDYLGLPVIAAAISLRTTIKAKRKIEPIVKIYKPNLNETEVFDLNDLTYLHSREYFKSGIKVCKKLGFKFSSGISCTVKSDIPFQAGCSSSSSIMVSWIYLLSKFADNPINFSLKKLGELAYCAEVIEFNEPGGMMDQYTTSIGNILYIESHPVLSIKKLNPKLGFFILGDSKESKNTISILNRCKEERLRVFKKLNLNKDDISCISFSSINNTLENEDLSILKGTLRNRDILYEGLELLSRDKLDHMKLGALLMEQHSILRDIFNISTPKIERMLDAALDAGAIGGKINGSGGGGCMFAYTLQDPERVATAIEQVGGKAFIVKIDNGVHEIV